MVSDRVRALVAEHIVSVEQLEILLLLRDEDRDWSPEQINDHIKSSATSVLARLADLTNRGFVRRDGPCFRYDRRQPQEAAVAELAKAYSEAPFTIIDLIFAKPTDPLLVFARAFRLWDSEED